jgi:subtilisin family serine protease
MDTGCGPHPWWDDLDDPRPDADRIVSEDLVLDGQPVGLTDHRTNVEDGTGDAYGPLDGALDAVSGHGSFICGLVHQTCPDADIVSVRIVYSDGIIIESELVAALRHIAELVERHASGRDDGRPVDVLNLSMGYYHETLTDTAFDPVMRDLLDRIARAGTVVVTSAGNDATARPMFPAAFADFPPEPGAPQQAAPVVAVGAENPDGTVALFSNAGPHVRVWAPGAALVSTMPIGFDGGYQPAGRRVHRGRERASLDPDNFSGGFGVWSGTSFAAPVVAGRVAAALLAVAAEGGGLPETEPEPGPRVTRAWQAVERAVALAADTTVETGVADTPS